MLKLYIKAQNLLESLKKDERGQVMIEYAIMIGVVTVGVITSIQAVAAWVGTQWTTLQNAI